MATSICQVDADICIRSAMPRSAPRPCSAPTCSVLVHDGSGRCGAHPREAWVKVVPAKRITGRRLQAMRAALFARDPLCAECRRQGRAVPATQRDHIIPLSEGGPDDETNEQGLCGECHEVKSRAEAIYGRWRQAIVLPP
ncbi:HNH endonuclease [Pseudoduganella lurida]|uniref:HNH endonuclease n=1 Tax=Pseudoduganella lurida TaxID=1036180 RepID=UPI0027D9AC38|nr:HNH endonuclease signature motif containing protein [Pseudoduganella lurida]